MTIEDLIKNSRKINFGVVCIKDKESTCRFYQLPADLEKLLAKYGACANFDYDVEIVQFALNIDIKD